MNGDSEKPASKDYISPELALVAQIKVNMLIFNFEYMKALIY